MSDFTERLMRDQSKAWADRHTQAACPVCETELSADGACWSCDWGPTPEHPGWSVPLSEINLRAFKHEAETPMRGHDDECCKRAINGDEETE